MTIGEAVARRAASARCRECGALIGTGQGDSPPHLPTCRSYAEWILGMQNVAGNWFQSEKG
jgi:hypothetical protein